ncbi:MAG: YitT family protein [Alicyclobacillus sp.]|nr:YitT family protein [Alicyclobacillus sp.]
MEWRKEAARVNRNARAVSLTALLRSKGHPIAGILLRILLILAGDFIGAVGINNFLVPAHILAGGITGVAQLIHHFRPVPIGTLYFLFNIPLFAVGYKYLGKRFIALTGVGIVGFSVFTDVVHLPLHLPKTDPLLMGLYGGVLSGISSGVLIRAGGSAGGIDILSIVLNRVTGKGVGSASFGMNALVVVLSMSVFGVEAGMYTLVSMFAAARVVNSLMHFQQRKTAVIVSADAEAIAAQIHRRLGRGSTLIPASGTYTHAELGVLLCTLTQLEVDELSHLAREVDPHVFIAVLDTGQVFGRFRQIAV